MSDDSQPVNPPAYPLDSVEVFDASGRAYTMRGVKVRYTFNNGGHTLTVYVTEPF